jgi:hypothetical protein
MNRKDIAVGKRVWYRRTGDRAWGAGVVHGFYGRAVFVNSRHEGIIAVFPFMLRSR